MRNYYKLHTPLNRDSILEAGDTSDLKGLSDMHGTHLGYLGAFAFYLGFRNIWTPSMPLLKNVDYVFRERRPPRLVTFVWEPGVEKKHRCGLPKTKAFPSSRGFLWLSNMEAPNEGYGRGITDFFVRKAVYRALFHQ